MNEVDDSIKTDLKSYQRLIGKLMYLSFATRPNIAFVIGQLSKRNAKLRVGHLRVARKVLRYLKGIMHLEITYKISMIDLKSYDLIGYADSNYAGNLEDKKSVMDHYFFINGAVVS